MSFRQIWRLLLNKKLLVGISVSSRTPWPIELVPRQAGLHKRNCFKKNKNTCLIQLQLPNNCQKHARLKTENRNRFLPFIKYSEKPHSDETASCYLAPYNLFSKVTGQKGIHSHNPRCFTVYLYPLSIQLELCYTIGNCIYCALYI